MGKKQPTNIEFSEIWGAPNYKSESPGPYFLYPNSYTFWGIWRCIEFTSVPALCPRRPTNPYRYIKKHRDFVIQLLGGSLGENGGGNSHRRLLSPRVIPSPAECPRPCPLLCNQSPSPANNPEWMYHLCSARAQSETLGSVEKFPLGSEHLCRIESVWALGMGCVQTVGSSGLKAFEHCWNCQPPLLALDPFGCCGYMRVKSLQSCPTTCDPYWLQSTRLILSMGFSRQEHWCGLPCPT